MKNLKLNDVITEKSQNEIQDSFSLATGFGVIFTDAQGNHIGSKSNFCRFCTKINETEKGAFYCSCTNKNAIAIALKTKKPCIYICHAGLINIEIPLIYEDECIGAITAGNVLCSEDNLYPRDPAPADINWLDDPELAAYYREIPVVTPKQIDGTTAALSNITNYIIQTAAYARIQKQLAERSEELLEMEIRRSQLEKQLKLAQLDALQKQVTPHFIFNVINSISRLMSLEEYDTAKEMLDSFACMMRYSLANIKSYVTLGQELAYIESYLAIQKIRFGSRIDYNIYCAKDLESMFIPFFSIQPLVENAVEHGILGKPCGGKLILQCLSLEEYVYIRIKDDGIGIPSRHLAKLCADMKSSEPPGAQHVGLYNCYHRFRMSFKKRVSFSIKSQSGKGTVITIKIQKE